MNQMKLLATLLSLLLLVGCGQRGSAAEKPEQAPPAVQSGAVQETAPEATGQSGGRPTAEELGRPETAELVFLLEGVEETLPATLYTDPGYSLYIPDEGWRLDDRDRDDGVQEVIWESTVNDDAELWVLSMGNRTLEQAQGWLQREEDDYSFQQDKQGGLWGTDPEDRMEMEVRFHPAEGALYAVVYTYPQEAAEGFATRLSVMADTFEVVS